MLSIRSRWCAPTTHTLHHTWTRATAGSGVVPSALSAVSPLVASAAAVFSTATAASSSSASSLVRTQRLAHVGTPFVPRPSPAALQTRPFSIMGVPVRFASTDANGSAKSGSAKQTAAAAKPAGAAAPSIGATDASAPTVSARKRRRVHHEKIVPVDFSGVSMAAAQQRVIQQRQKKAEEWKARPLVGGQDQDDTKGVDAPPASAIAIVKGFVFPLHFDPRYEPPPRDAFQRTKAFRFDLTDPGRVGRPDALTVGALKVPLDAKSLALWHQRCQYWISPRAQMRNAIKIKQRQEYVAKGWPTRQTASEAEFQQFVLTNTEYLAWQEKASVQAIIESRPKTFDPALEPSAMFPGDKFDKKAPEKYHPSFEPISPALWAEYGVTARDSGEYREWFVKWLKENPQIAKQREVYQRLVAKYVKPVWRARASAESDRMVANERIRADLYRLGRAFDPSEIAEVIEPQIDDEDDYLWSAIEDENADLEELDEYEADLYHDAEDSFEEYQKVINMTPAERAERRAKQLASWDFKNVDDFDQTYGALPADFEKQIYQNPARFSVAKGEVDLDAAKAKWDKAYGKLAERVSKRAWSRVYKAIDKANAAGRAAAKKYAAKTLRAQPAEVTPAARATAISLLAADRTALVNLFQSLQFARHAPFDPDFDEDEDDEQLAAQKEELDEWNQNSAEFQQIVEEIQSHPRLTPEVKAATVTNLQRRWASDAILRKYGGVRLDSDVDAFAAEPSDRDLIRVFLENRLETGGRAEDQSIRSFVEELARDPDAYEKREDVIDELEFEQQLEAFVEHEVKTLDKEDNDAIEGEEADAKIEAPSKDAPVVDATADAQVDAAAESAPKEAEEADDADEEEDALATAEAAQLAKAKEEKAALAEGAEEEEEPSLPEELEDEDEMLTIDSDELDLLTEKRMMETRPETEAERLEELIDEKAELLDALEGEDAVQAEKELAQLEKQLDVELEKEGSPPPYPKEKEAEATEIFRELAAKLETSATAIDAQVEVIYAALDKLRHLTGWHYPYESNERRPLAGSRGPKFTRAVEETETKYRELEEICRARVEEREPEVELIGDAASPDALIDTIVDISAAGVPVSIVGMLPLFMKATRDQWLKRNEEWLKLSDSEQQSRASAAITKALPSAQFDSPATEAVRDALVKAYRADRERLEWFATDSVNPAEDVAITELEAFLAKELASIKALKERDESKLQEVSRSLVKLARAATQSLESREKEAAYAQQFEQLEKTKLEAAVKTSLAQLPLAQLVARAHLVDEKLRQDDIAALKARLTPEQKLQQEKHNAETQRWTGLSKAAQATEIEKAYAARQAAVARRDELRELKEFRSDDLTPANASHYLAVKDQLAARERAANPEVEEANLNAELDLLEAQIEADEQQLESLKEEFEPELVQERLRAEYEQEAAEYAAELEEDPEFRGSPPINPDDPEMAQATPEQLEAEARDPEELTADFALYSRRIEEAQERIEGIEERLEELEQGEAAAPMETPLSEADLQHTVRVLRKPFYASPDEFDVALKAHLDSLVASNKLQPSDVQRADYEITSLMVQAYGDQQLTEAQVDQQIELEKKFEGQEWSDVLQGELTALEAELTEEDQVIAALGSKRSSDALVPAASLVIKDGQLTLSESSTSTTGQDAKAQWTSMYAFRKSSPFVDYLYAAHGNALPADASTAPKELAGKRYAEFEEARRNDTRTLRDLLVWQEAIEALDNDELTGQDLALPELDDEPVEGLNEASDPDDPEDVNVHEEEDLAVSKQLRDEELLDDLGYDITKDLTIGDVVPEFDIDTEGSPVLAQFVDEDGEYLPEAEVEASPALEVRHPAQRMTALNTDAHSESDILHPLIPEDVHDFPLKFLPLETYAYLMQAPTRFAEELLDQVLTHAKDVGETDFVPLEEWDYDPKIGEGEKPTPVKVGLSKEEQQALAALNAKDEATRAADQAAWLADQKTAMLSPVISVASPSADSIQQSIESAQEKFLTQTLGFHEKEVELSWSLAPRPCIVDKDGQVIAKKYAVEDWYRWVENYLPVDVNWDHPEVKEMEGADDMPIEDDDLVIEDEDVLPEWYDKMKKELTTKYFYQYEEREGMHPDAANRMVPNPHVQPPEISVDEKNGHQEYLISDESSLYNPYRTDVSIPFEARAAGSLNVRSALHHFELRRRPADDIERDILELSVHFGLVPANAADLPTGRLAHNIREIELARARAVEPTKEAVEKRAKEVQNQQLLLEAQAAAKANPDLASPSAESSTGVSRTIPAGSLAPIEFSPTNQSKVEFERETTASLLSMPAQAVADEAGVTTVIANVPRRDLLPEELFDSITVGPAEIDETLMHEIIREHVDEYQLYGLDKYGRVLTNSQIDLAPHHVMQKALARIGYLPNQFENYNLWSNRTLGSANGDLYNREAMIQLYMSEFSNEARMEKIREKQLLRDANGNPHPRSRLSEEDRQFLALQEMDREEEDYFEHFTQEEIAIWNEYHTDQGIVQWIAEGGLYKTQSAWAEEMKRGSAAQADALEDTLEDYPMLFDSDLSFEENDELILKEEADRVERRFELMKLLEWNPEMYVEYFDPERPGEFTKAGRKQIEEQLAGMPDPAERIKYLKEMLHWKQIVGGETVATDKWKFAEWMQAHYDHAQKLIDARRAAGRTVKKDEDDDDDAPAAKEADEAAPIDVEGESVDDDAASEVKLADDEVLGDDGVPMKRLRVADGSFAPPEVIEQEENGVVVRFYRDPSTLEVRPLTSAENIKWGAPQLSLDEQFALASARDNAPPSEDDQDKATEAEDDDESTPKAYNEEGEEIEPEVTADGESFREGAGEQGEDENKFSGSTDAPHPLLAKWSRPSALRHVKELPHMDSARYNEFQSMLFLKQKLYKMLSHHFPTGGITLKLNQPQLFYPERLFRQHYGSADINLRSIVNHGGASGLQLFQVIFLMRKYRNASILAEHIARELGLARSHGAVLRQVESIVKWMEAIPGLDTGLKIKVSGRINGAARAKHFVIKSGNIPLQTFHANIDYGFAAANARIGVFGVKVWLFQRKLDRKEMQSYSLLRSGSKKTRNKLL